MYRAPLRSTISPPLLRVIALYKHRPSASRYSHFVSERCTKLCLILFSTSEGDIVHFNSMLLFSSTSFCRFFPLGTRAGSLSGNTITFTMIGLTLLAFFFFCAGRATHSSRRVKPFRSLQGKTLWSRKHSRKLFRTGTTWFGNPLHRVHHFQGDPGWLYGCREKDNVCITIHLLYI